ncbi:serpin A12-like [Pyxicephalus adspersus]|uniref:serpin A12-like n=1 Tax=Pyxicephalus adspersus TaxID=30357 RepID=UPI003B599E51
MKVLLFLCVSAALVPVAILYDGYLKMKVDKHYPPLNPQDYIYVIVAFKTKALDNLFEALEDPDSSVSQTNNITIFVDKNWHPQNTHMQTVSKDFATSGTSMSSVNTLVKEKTSGKILNLVTNVNKNTVTVIVNTNDALKVPSPGGTRWTKELSGKYMKVENKVLGVTLVELPFSQYVSILLAIPAAGKEEELGKSLTAPTIEEMRKSMTLQRVNLEVPRVTLYAASFLTVDIMHRDDGEVIGTRYGYKVSAQFP